VKLRAYKKRVQSLNDKIVVQEIWAPELVPLIEKWEFKDSSFENILKNYLDKFDSDIEAIVLGCTHYSLIKDQIKNISNKQIIDPSYDSAIKFREYLKRHLKIKNSLSLWWKTIFYTTWDITNFLKTWKMFIKNLNLSQIKKAQI
jgi:glutamate racemase